MVALSSQIVDVEIMRKIAWSGIPRQYRPRAWRIFLDYEPIISDQSFSTLQHKRKDYFDCLNRFFDPQQQILWTSSQRDILSQILRDLPRMQSPLLRNEKVSTIFQHVLFTYAVRHPASGYVQGMNDVLFPFFIVFLSQHFKTMTIEDIVLKTDVDSLSATELNEVEADSFWCFNKFLDGVQDFYTKDQPGMYKMIDQLHRVIGKVDPELYNYLEQENVQYTSFAIRWMNCMLVREFSISVLLRIWDLYVSEPSKIAMTQVYICASMMTYISPELMKLKQCDLLDKLKNIPPDYWTNDIIEIILAQSFVYEKAFFSPKKF
ncbi:TBC domain containing protein [Histomonas meleagridis]|uniref:TBC domain containing protein n=1 Tax=Histomonas meleagridis TaxID=135588 RepID=UPI00355A1714|nr:TBC domain containing protein [Histomonas meleagridis]KAH0796430.1 TBC domain containing protein [Histomonas meleagridis]